MARRTKYRKILVRYRITLSILLVIFITWIFCLPANLFNSPTSTVVNDKSGRLIGARIAEDGQWRFPEIDSIPENFAQCIIHYEDRLFYFHPGINPWAIVKAFWNNLTTDKRIGGSTITQQVMRLSHKNPPRTYLGKFIETFQATRLELSYSKQHILRLYVSHAPFGGNVVGLPAATWRYYGVSPDRLSWGEAATLAVLPNAPSLIFPGKNEQVLKEKRDELLRKLYKNKIIDETTYSLSIEEPLPGKPLALPNLAQHFTDKIHREYSGQNFQSSIDLNLQSRMNHIVENHYNVLRQNHINNIAVLVLDVKTRQTLVYIGNSPTSEEKGKYVDIIDKRRSTGSVLKPFLYAAMLDDGAILPRTLKSDIPTVIDGYRPQNFNKTYSGMSAADQALTQSLNVPYVRMLQKYGLVRFHNILKKVQQQKVDKPADHYGLAMILGGAESTLMDVTSAYAGMASTLINYVENSDEYYSEEFTSPIFTRDQQAQLGILQSSKPVFSAAAIYHTLNTLKELNRPVQDANWKLFSSAQTIGWKTGTSFGYKDAWAVGVTPSYAIGVWVGNADGEGRPELVGIQAAAPILFDVLNELPRSTWFPIPYDDMTEVETCRLSGHIATEYCDNPIKEWIPKVGTRTQPCPYHHRIFLDKNKQYRVNSACYPLTEMKAQHWFTIPPVQEYYFKNNNPSYQILPPFKEGCWKQDKNMMAFIYPKPNETITLPKDFDEKINDVIFRLAHRESNSKVYWYLDAQYLGSTTTFHEISVNPSPGTYILTAVDQEGNEIQIKIHIRRT